MEALNALETPMMAKLGEWGGGLLDPIMKFISVLGDHGMIMVAVMLALLCFRRTRRAGIAAALALCIGTFMGNLILKPLVARIRPYDFDPALTLLIPPQDDFSFPSGHSMAAFELAIPLLRYHRKWGIAALVFAFLMAFARVYVMVHYPTDVIAGAVIGTLAGIAGVLLTEWIIDKADDRLKKLVI